MSSEAVTSEAAIRPRRRRRSTNLLAHVVLTLGAVTMVGPFVWEILTSVKTYAESIHIPPTIVPTPFQWHNYSTLFQEVPFGSELVNTTIITTLRVLGQVLTCSLGGYVFARLRFPGRQILLGILLSILMVPSQMFLLPQYQIVKSLGMLDTVPGVIVPGLVSAFGVFLMRQFFMQLPQEIEEAARLDGANPFQIYWRIMLPLTVPGMLVLAIITAIWSWNDLLWPLMVTTSPEKMPVSVGLANLQGEHATDYPVLMAGALVASLPMLAAFIIFQKYLIAGISFRPTKRS